jgi:ParB family transcriptional regulator, chromosome partitioning protein
MMNLQRRLNAAGMRLKIASMKSRPDKLSSLSEQKNQAGVMVTIGHNGKPVYHCGLVERGAKGLSTNGDESNSPEQEKEDLSAALVQDLTTQRTAALRAALSIRPDIALIAITHNLAAQIFYDQTYLLSSSLTVRTVALLSLFGDRLGGF